jgi:hypothetical protein
VLKFKNPNRVPPGGQWFFKVKETGEFFEDRGSINSLYDKVIRHYVSNKIKVPANLRDLIEDYICANVHESFCSGDREGYPKVKSLDFFSIIKFTEVLFSRITVGAELFYVPSSQAEQRALICGGESPCPENNLNMCVSCNGLRKWGAKLLGNRKTCYDSRLGVCAKCGCLLTAKIHVNIKCLNETEETVKELPESCWIKREYHELHGK